jgi:hypothetical protein
VADVDLKLRTVVQILERLHHPRGAAELPKPQYNGCSPSGIGLAVESMKRHTTNEGWELFAALEANGYQLYGHQIGSGETDLRRILDAPDAGELSTTGVVVMQDKREWDVQRRDFRDKHARFHAVGMLKDRRDVFKLTVLKDAQQQPEYHRHSAEEIGCNAWIVYYHPLIVKHVAPYVRLEHLVRTYHTIDAAKVPEYQDRTGRCCISGAVSNAYPLRKRLVEEVRRLYFTDHLKHPGYHMRGTQTHDYLMWLSQYRVAICTSSIYGYALRKIVEATAAGCIVVTDLPTDEVLPEIDGNVRRISTQASIPEINDYLKHLCRHDYDPERQRDYAERCKRFYDYRAAGARLAADIEIMRKNYNG